MSKNNATITTTATLIDTGDNEILTDLNKSSSSSQFIDVQQQQQQQQHPIDKNNYNLTSINNSLINNINNSNNSIVNLSKLNTQENKITTQKQQRNNSLDSDQQTLFHVTNVTTELTDFDNSSQKNLANQKNINLSNEEETFNINDNDDDEDDDYDHEFDDANDHDRLITNADDNNQVTSSRSKYRGNTIRPLLDSDSFDYNISKKSSPSNNNQNNRATSYLRRKLIKATGGRTFRGSYRYSRIQITMAILRKFLSLLIEKSTLALFGAFLIHVTLGTIYTLSNINSYLTSYMRLHGSPNATYGGSMWISSSYAVGQGFSMVLGGLIEKRFSARLSCILGCLLHSSSTMLTSLSIKYGPWAVLVTYGFIPGFGCGLAYMTPMSNGFGWFPNRKGLVAGVILAGFGIGTFIFNMAQTAYVNPDNLSPPEDSNGYFTQSAVLDRVPHLFVFIGTIYAIMQFIGCCLLFKPPNQQSLSRINNSTIKSSSSSSSLNKGGIFDNVYNANDDERPILMDQNEMSIKDAVRTREFIVLFIVYGVTTQGVLFVNSMLKEYGQLFIDSDMYLAWTGSMASIANSMGRLVWGLAIDRFSFTKCFTSITVIFGSLMFVMPFEFILSSKLFYLLCTLGLFGSFSGWMSTYPVHLSRVFGRTNSGIIYGLIFVSQAIGGIFTALGAHYLIDHFSRFVPFFCVVILEILGLSVYHLFYPK